jgi:hypothetical protein
VGWDQGIALSGPQTNAATKVIREFRELTRNYFSQRADDRHQTQILNNEGTKE